MFFLAPLLHVYWDQWMAYVIPPDDWRPWLGRMALLNLVGVVFYRGARGLLAKPRLRPAASLWRIVPGRFYLWLTILMALSLIAQAWVYLTFGGIRGYITAFEERSEQFTGLGPVFIVSESFPILFMIGFVYWASRRQSQASWATLLFVLAMFFVLRFVFGGLRGSRGTSIWAMYWALGLIHLWVRPISKRMLLQFAMAGLLFMYVYGFYKSLGIESLGSIFSPTELSGLEEESGRTVQLLVLGDLSRADVQAMIAYQLSPDGNALQHRYPLGETYLSALALMVPLVEVGTNLVSKVDAGTFVLQGGSRSILRSSQETRVYGIAGEAALNFGLAAIPIAYAVLGFIVQWVSRWRFRLAGNDARLFLVPFASVVVFYPLVWDLDNVLILCTQFGLIPFFLLWVASTKCAGDVTG
jgi:hypothetical protein